MDDREKVIAWLADEELYYRDHGDTHNSLMACDALALLREQEQMYYTLEHDWKMCRKLLKEQEEQIRQLKKERNEVYYSGYDGSFIL